MQLHQYEEELKHNLDKMILPSIPHNSVQSAASGHTNQMLQRYTKMIDDVELPFERHQ